MLDIDIRFASESSLARLARLPFFFLTNRFSKEIGVALKWPVMDNVGFLVCWHSGAGLAFG